MVIELSGVQFGLKSYAWFQNRTSAACSFDLKSQVWFQTKLHSTQFNCHFIRSILKSHNFIALIFRLLVYCSSSRFVKKKRNRKCLYVLFSMQNDVMWRKLIRAWQRNKQFWSQNENSLLQLKKFNSRRLNQWWHRPFFLLWLRLRLFIAFREGIWRCILRDFAMDFFWVVKVPRVHDAQWMVRFFFFHTV